MDSSFKDSINEFCTLNLISLYLEISEKNGFVPLSKRNAFLVKRLKKQHKATAYKAIKSEIKTLIVKSNTLDVEKQLILLSDIVRDGSKVELMQEQWVDFLLRLQGFGYDLQVGSCDDIAAKNTIYVIKDEIHSVFQKTGKLGPVSLYLYLDTEVNLKSAIKLISADTVFEVVAEQSFGSHSKMSLVLR